MGAGRVVRRWAATVVVFCAVFGCASAWALSDEELFRELGIDFRSPGARAGAMGGAAVASADDVTATISNPAALHLVDGPHALVELRHVDRDAAVERSELGSLAVDGLTGERELPFFGVTSTADYDPVDELGFVGFVWPFEVAGRRLTVAAARHTLLSAERSLGGPGATETRFAFESFPNSVVGADVQAYSVATPAVGTVETDITSWNVAAAYDVHDDFSIGATFGLAALEMRSYSATEIVDPLELFVDPSHPRLPGMATTDLFESTIDDSDSDVSFSLGLHWHPDSVFASGASPWRFAAVYHGGSRFDVAQRTTLNGIDDLSFQSRVVVPDRYAIGATYRPRDAWLVTFEVERVEYSDLMDGFVSGVNYVTSGRIAGLAYPIDPDASIVYQADDGTVPKLGVEYTREMGAGRRLFLRAGWFRSADDRIHMTQFNSTDPAVNAVYVGAFGAGSEDDHVTAGAGFEFGRFAVHGAGEFSDEGSRVSASFVYTLDRP